MPFKNKFISHYYSLPTLTLKTYSISCLFIMSILMGCSTTTPKSDIKEGYTSNVIEREKHLALLTSWQVKGKIAFINSEERQSASLYWNKVEKDQQLNLTTYLGINVLKLTSESNKHVIEVDGKTFKGSDLDNLINSLVNIRFPAEALSYWIKAIPYSNNDKLTFTPQTQLPLTLTSQYNGYHWDIKYSSYQTKIFDKKVIALPNKIKITSGDLTINIAINHWTI